VIVRILTARVADRNAAAFEEVLRQQLPLMREHAGLVYVKLARQSHPGYEQVLLFEEWRDAAALYGWAGNDIQKPRLLPGAEGLADSVEVVHYEALDIDPDEISATWPPQATEAPDHDAPPERGSEPDGEPAAGGDAPAAGRESGARDGSGPAPAATAPGRSDSGAGEA
jgi:heme-degrading monooxygenase HmoA